MQIPETPVTKDRFGNSLPFVALPKDKNCPPDSIGAGPVLKRKDSEGNDMTLKLDILHIARGRGDDTSSSKGWRYYGLNITKDNLYEWITFYGEAYAAQICNRTYNIENQKFCDDSITKKWSDDELLQTLTERSVKAESKLAVFKEMNTIKDELAKLTKDSPEYLAKMEEMMQAAVKFATPS